MADTQIAQLAIEIAHDAEPYQLNTRVAQLAIEIAHEADTYPLNTRVAQLAIEIAHKADPVYIDPTFPEDIRRKVYRFGTVWKDCSVFIWSSGAWRAVDSCYFYSGSWR